MAMKKIKVKCQTCNGKGVKNYGKGLETCRMCAGAKELDHWVEK